MSVGDNHCKIREGKPEAASLGLYQTVADGVADQTGCFMDVELLHKPCSVRFGSLYTDPQLHRDGLCGLSFSNELKNLTLSP
jgi:hypothetical protein